MKNLVSILLLLIVTASAQENPIRMRQFLGLDTKSSDFVIQPNAARIAHEIDLSRNLGSLTKRYGYDSISTISGQDSVIAIHSVPLADGREYMAVVTDSDGVGYGNVYVGGYGSVNITNDSLTEIETQWGTQYKPSFSVLNDVLYITNGSHGGIAWNGQVLRHFPLPAPGELRIRPIEDTGSSSVYTLDGEYRYAVVMRTPDSTGAASYRYTMGYVSAPIRVKSGRVWLGGLQHLPTQDSVNTTQDSVVSLLIYRTPANPGFLDVSDSLYIVDSITIYDTSSLASYYMIDSIPDDTIQTFKGRSAFFWDSDTVYNGRDSLGGCSFYYGAPRYVGAGVRVYDTAGDTTSNIGIFYGIPKQKDTLGVAYMCTFIDTITGIESDSSRSLVVMNPPDTTLDSIQIALPRIPADDSGLVINIYRAMLAQITYDTGHFFGAADSKLGPTAYSVFSKLFVNFPTNRSWIEKLAVDTVVLIDYFLLAQVPATDTLYTDTVRYDSLSVKRRFVRPRPPHLIDRIFTYQSRLFGVTGSALHFSRLDSAYAWGAFDFVSLNAGDGDEITVAFPTQGGIIVCKNKSTYLVYQNSDGEWYENEITGLPGCIAPKSYAKGMGGHYYLSDYGVIRLTDGKQLNRRHDALLVSAQLDNFENLSTATKRDAVGLYDPRARQYRLCIGDTTYVYDEQANGWTTWSLTFASAGLYGVESELAFVPGDTVYFVRPGDSTLYRYGSSELDAGGVIQMIYESAPLLTDERNNTIQRVGVWANIDTTGGSGMDSLYFYLRDERGQIVHPSPIKTELTIADRYVEQSMKQATKLYLSMYFQTSVADTLGILEIDGLDIWWTDQGREQVK